MRKRSPGAAPSTGLGWFTYTVGAALLLLWTLGPIAWSAVISLTPQREDMTSPASFFPQNPTLDNYAALVSTGDQLGGQFLQALGNTTIVALGTIVIGLPIAAIGAYALSRLTFRGRSILNMALLATLVIPVLATVIPLFKMFADLGLVNSFPGLVLVYISAALPLVVWLMSSYFASLPREIEEAAYVDGCGQFMTFIRIVLPVSYPILLASALIIFLTTWNQFLIPLVLAPSEGTKPIAVVISEFVTKTQTNYGLMNAGGILSIVVPCVIAVVFRRFLTFGLTAGATKG